MKKNLKVYYKNHPRKTQSSSVQYNSQTSIQLPMIRLSDTQLENFGFHVGDHIEVIYNDNQIIINKL